MATTIAGITVKVVDFKRRPDEVSGGPRRVVNGALRGDLLWAKKSWEATVYAANATESDTLRAAVGPTAAVTVAGDLFHGSSFSAIVEVQDTNAVRLPSGFYEMLDLTIRQA